MIMNKKNYIAIIILTLSALVTATIAVVNAQVTPTFRTGDIVTAVNNTTRDADWGDPVAADPGQIIEYRIMVQNMTEGSVATDVLVKASFPTTASVSPQVTMSASANEVTVSDTATVNVSGGNTHLIIYEPGHTRVFSPACPGGCNADDSFRDGGPINIGHLGFGESAQILFKAGITNPGPVAPPSPSPSPSPSMSPSPSPSVAPSPAAGGPNITNTNTVTVNNPAPSAQPQVLAVKTLPKTGLPVTVLLGFGALPTGFFLRKFTKGSKIEEDPEFIWKDRQFRLD